MIVQEGNSIDNINNKEEAIGNRTANSQNYLYADPISQLMMSHSYEQEDKINQSFSTIPDAESSMISSQDLS